MLPVNGRQLENVKGELLKLKKKEAADCQLWHNVARTEEQKKQKNQAIADCQSWDNVASKEEPKKQKNKKPIGNNGTTWPGEKSRRNRRTKK
ncbi:hypothetical protein AVEN_259631-1 [Araneus ventricosus]|uniref:Uncharacterized protein n=1 Tax=Araneus ventricosus TaxID=182803 RepID=A0A4Y2SJB7_ARAVE|nr:hypothetical protein AVEN_92889-1 [Araneus ventricosus]GBN88747.1 hypothetical protein AVEN_259631-1 [Araneus ventricosus]